MQEVLKAIDRFTLRDFEIRESHAQASNIINLIELIVDFQDNSPCSSVQQYRAYGVSGQEIICFLSKLKAGEADNEKYKSIIGRLRLVRDTLLNIVNKDKVEKFDNEYDEYEADEDAELSNLRLLATKLIMNISDSTRYISRSERDLISKSLLDYIILKSVKSVADNLSSLVL